MYSETVIEQRLSDAAASLGLAPPIRHTKDYCWNFAEHLDRLRNSETGELTRALTREEFEFIENEKLICAYDFLHWVTRWAWISDQANRLTRVKPNIAQGIVTDVWADLEAKGREIVIMELKSRQLGVSTWSELAVAHRVQFHQGVNAVVASADQKRSEKMAEMMTLCWDRQPWWLVPEMSVSNRFQKVFRDLNSGVSIQHGAQTSGIARGTTVTCAHLSEVSSYEDPYDLIDASLMRAIHPNPWVFVVLESTALQTDDWWHFNWKSAKTGYAHGKNRFYPLFLPWFIGRDIYPTPTWLKQQTQMLAEQGKSYDFWEPEERTVLHAQKCEAFTAENSLLRKYLGTGWRMPKEQMFWWQQTRAEYVSKKALGEFRRELCASDVEAFTSVNQSVFDPELVTDLNDRAESIPVKGVFGLASKDLPERLWPSRRDLVGGLDPIVIDPSRYRMKETFPVTFYPIKWEGYSQEDGLGKLLIFEWPQDGFQYCFGVDTADGIGLDRSAVIGVRKGNERENDVQVCEFTSAYINAFDLWPIVTALACFYTVNFKGKLRSPKVSIECLGNGESTQNEMKKRGWWNFHLWQRYDNRRRVITNKLGWYTNSWSRPMMMDFGIKSVRDEWVDVRSPYLIEEFGKLERDEQRQSARAAYGAHDDRCMAFFIALFTLYDTEIRKVGTASELPSRAQRAFYRQVAGKEPEYPRYQGPFGNTAMTKKQQKDMSFFTGASSARTR